MEIIGVIMAIVMAVASLLVFFWPGIVWAFIFAVIAIVTGAVSIKKCKIKN